MCNNKKVCERLGLNPNKPEAGSKLGIALSTLGNHPINGLRHNTENGTNGWYIWCGEEYSDDENFFSPLHVEHIEKYLPEILEYLNLPVGYRFIIDNKDYEDIWYDAGLIND